MNRRSFVSNNAAIMESTFSSVNLNEEKCIPFIRKLSRINERIISLSLSREFVRHLDL